MHKTFSVNAAIKLYNLGLSPGQISRLLKVDRSSILRSFYNTGFPTRSTAMSKSIRYSKQEFEEYFLNNQEFMAAVEAMR